MTFTWTGALDTDLELVRFHTGDTDENGYYLSDETITALLTSESTVGGAVVACLKYIIGQLSRPDFKADWLQVSHETARQGMSELLRMKYREFGIAQRTTSVQTVYRADSYETEEPDYSDGV